jgi:hypothetical protein
MYLTRKDLMKRWGVSLAHIENIPPNLLPYLNISPAGKRGSYRYHVEDVKHFETENRVSSLDAKQS